MKCHHCNQEHNESLKFCPLTGYEIKSQELCPHCGQPVDPLWQHCGYCGQEIKKANKVDQGAIAPSGIEQVSDTHSISHKLPWRSILGGVGAFIFILVVFLGFWKIINPDETLLPAGPHKEKTEQPTIQPITLSKIAFASDRDGNYEIYTMNLDGSDLFRLTNNPAYDGSPAWSFDGQKIAFHTERDGNAEIYSVAKNGTDLYNLTNNPAQDFFPDWSPDMNKIVFQSSRDNNWEIYVMNSDGSEQTRLTNTPGEKGGPRWSPDGQRIAYSAKIDGNMEIFVMNADGSNPVNITNNPAFDGAPSWSPDGQRIVFNSYRDENWKIYVMNVDGTNQYALSSNSGNFGYPDWSPDGQKIIFTSDSNGSWDMYIMDVDGHNIELVLGNQINDGYPRFSPGSSLLVSTTHATITQIPPQVISPTVSAPTINGHRDIDIVYVIEPTSELFSDRELFERFQSKIGSLLSVRDITLTWVITDPNSDILNNIQSLPNEFDIVILAVGQTPIDISLVLRGWLQEGGVIWAFDNGTYSTWRNQDLFGGLILGADKTWEPPEEVQAMVLGLNVFPYDERQAVAYGVEGAIFVAGNPTILFDPATNSIYSFLTRFDRALDETTVPLLKAQKIGEASLGRQTPQPQEWIVAGFAKRVGKGLAVILPFLGQEDVSSQQFQANLIEWCLDQVGK